ncbi:MAG: sirohydrochlorin chelatase [Chromatiaceae bacterium]|nr:sirohydrochlorin chelatase [Chromatiaceae bacterium]
MKETILLVGHGSRDPGGEGNREVEAFARLWRERQPDWNIQVCFIEFANLLVAEGLTQAARDADRVIVVPLILNAAGHVKMELPEHLQAARAAFPDTEFIYVPHLGAEDTILEVLKRRLGQALDELDRPDPQTTGVILLGRGSSDPMANGEVAKMARWLFEASDHDLVEIAFTGVAYPRLERVVQRQAQLGMTQIIVLPYYLFTGSLMERIKRQMEHLRRQYPRLRFAQGAYFGFEEEIFDLLEQRVRQGQEGTGLMPCDGCKYRELARDGTGGHHHHEPGPGHGHHHEHHHHPHQAHPAHPLGGQHRPEVTGIEPGNHPRHE